MVGRGPLVVTVDEEAETRVRDVFVLSAPVTGRLRRIEAEVGDRVIAGETLIAQIEPADPEFLDLWRNRGRGRWSRRPNPVSPWRRRSWWKQSPSSSSPKASWNGLKN